MCLAVYLIQHILPGLTFDSRFAKEMCILAPAMSLIIGPDSDTVLQAFLYAILNVGVRPNIGKLLDLGPSRKMLDLGGVIPKQQ